METNFSSDRPAHKAEEDRFQRYGFSKRVAQTIIQRKNEDCLVMGIYGAWGEGKTSVLNFIESELSQDKKTIVIKFNPWRYNDEQSLLLQFFGKLASGLSAKLKTKSEEFGSQLKKYGELLSVSVPVIGNIGGVAKSAGKLLSDTDVDELKSRIEKIIKESGRRVVIIIDDIDRLEKEEIHSIFRLVRLNADFLKTTYILSFDDAMVSAAIGERFGEGNTEAGQNFLEKIVQVPLRLPLAQPEALKKFCFNLVDEAIKSNKIEIEEKEVRRFASEFISHVLLRLSTPRLAVRYGNTLSFSLALLYREVNTADVMLMEAVKIFYPTHYQFIKDNPEYFIGTYSSGQVGSPNEEKKKAIRAHLEELGSKLLMREKAAIQSLLEELFPNLKQVFKNYGYHVDIENDWFKNKRVASPQYFSRYFSYTVLKGQVSDVAFQQFLAEAETQQISEIIGGIKDLIAQSSADNFLQKIRSIETDVDWSRSEKIALAVARASELFPMEDQSGFGFRFTSSNGQAAIFIYQLLKNHDNVDDRLNLAGELLRQSEPLEFACELRTWFGEVETPDEQLFDDQQILGLTRVLVERALSVSAGFPLFEKLPEQSRRLLGWWSDYDKEGLSVYYKNILNSDPLKCIDLLRAFTPTARSTAVAGPFKSDFTKEYYDYFVTVFDKDCIYDCLLKFYSEETLDAEAASWSRRGTKTQTDLNIVRQFRHWYNLDGKLEAPSEPHG